MPPRDTSRTTAPDQGSYIEPGSFQLTPVEAHKTDGLQLVSSTPATTRGQLMAELDVFGRKAVAVPLHGAVANRGEVGDGLPGGRIGG